MKTKRIIKRIFDAYCITRGTYAPAYYDDIRSVCSSLGICDYTQQDIVVVERLLLQYRITGIDPWGRSAIVEVAQ